MSLERLQKILTLSWLTVREEHHNISTVKTVWISFNRIFHLFFFHILQGLIIEEDTAEIQDINKTSYVQQR